MSSPNPTAPQRPKPLVYESKALTAPGPARKSQAAIRAVGHLRIMRDHDDGLPLLMQSAQHIHDAGDLGFAPPPGVSSAGVVQDEDAFLDHLVGLPSDGTTGQPGAIIQSILDGSAADAASLEVGDRIVAINNAPVQDPNDLFASIVRNRPGANVTVPLVAT